MHNGAHVLLLEVDNQVGLGGSLIGVIDTREALDLAGTSLLVDALAVRLLAVLEGSSDVDEEEGARLLDEVTGLLAGSLKGGDGGSNDSSAGLGKLGSDKSNAGDVDVAVLLAEAKLRGELVSHSLAQQHRHGSATALVERDLESAGNLVLSAVLVARHEDGETLLGRQRVLLTEDLDDLGVREPLGDLLASAKTVAQLGAGDVGGASALGDLVTGHVLVAVGEVDHLLELDHLDAELLLVLLHEVLGVIRAVVVLAVLVLAGASVVTADDEVSGTVVLSDDGVPEGLAGTTHAHGQGQESESSHAVGVSGQQSLVDTDTGEVVNIAGLGETDDGLDQDIGLLGASGANRQLTVSSVHGVSGLEGHDLLPAQLVKVGAELRGSDCFSKLASYLALAMRVDGWQLTAQVKEVVVLQAVDSLKLATNVELLGGGEEVLYTRVGIIVAAKDLLGLVDPVDSIVSNCVAVVFYYHPPTCRVGRHPQQ